MRIMVAAKAAATSLAEEAVRNGRDLEHQAQATRAERSAAQRCQLLALSCLSTGAASRTRAETLSIQCLRRRPSRSLAALRAASSRTARHRATNRSLKTPA